MHNGLKVSMAFVLGAAVSSVVTWKLLKTKYEQIVQEEIDSFKEMIKKKHNPDGEMIFDPKKIEEEETDEKTEYSDIVSRYKPEQETEKKGGSESMKEDSYITLLSPDEFAEDEEYDTECLVYYTDGKVADDQGNLIEDVDDVIGLASLETFGMYEDDSIFVRNDKYKCEYEVVKDYRRYDDVFNGTETNEPNLVDEE